MAKKDLNKLEIKRILNEIKNTDFTNFNEFGLTIKELEETEKILEDYAEAQLFKIEEVDVTVLVEEKAAGRKQIIHTAAIIKQYYKSIHPSKYSYSKMDLSINCGSRFFNSEGLVSATLRITCVNHFCGWMSCFLQVAKKL